MAQRVKRKIIWTIDNVSRRKFEKPGFEVFSDPFTLHLGDNITKWKLHMAVPECPSASDTDYSDSDDDLNPDEPYLSVCPRKLSVTRDDFLVNTELKFGGKLKDNLYNRKSIDYNAEESQEWLRFKTINDLFPKRFDEVDYLELEVEIEAFYFIHGNVETEPTNNYLRFYKDEKLADFTLKSSDGKEFKVHRFALVEKSEIFEKMVNTDMLEKSNGSATLSNINSDDLEDVIRYIYTGEIKIEDSKKAIALLDAAEEFAILGLKSTCVEYLSEDLSETNVMEFLRIADLYNAINLEDECLEFAVNNYDKIRNSEQFRTLEQRLWLKIMDSLANIGVTIEIETEI